MAVDPSVPGPADPDPRVPRPGAADEPFAAALGAVRKQQGQADQALGWTVSAVGVIPLLGGPAVATLIAPSVDTGGGWSGVFLSTLAFAAGVAAFVVVLRTRAFGELNGWPLVTVAGLCLLFGLALSAFVGLGPYTTQPVPATPTGTPLDLPGAFVTAAVASWGPVGALLSAGSGVVAGVWGVRLARAV